MYYPIFLAIFLALACPAGKSRNTSSSNRSSIHTNSVSDTTSIGGTGGDNGHVHP